MGQDKEVIMTNFSRLVALARQQAEANHWHMPNRPHGRHKGQVATCPHPDCVAAHDGLPKPWCQICGHEVTDIYCHDCHQATTQTPEPEE